MLRRSGHCSGAVCCCWLWRRMSSPRFPWCSGAHGKVTLQLAPSTLCFKWLDHDHGRACVRVHVRLLVLAHALIHVHGPLALMTLCLKWPEEDALTPAKALVCASVQ